MPDRGRGTERILDFDDDGARPTGALELDHGGSVPRVPADVPRPSAIVPISPLVPLPPPPPAEMALSTAAPAWLEPLSRLPESTSKRVAGYSLFALFIYVTFFSGSILT